MRIGPLGEVQKREVSERERAESGEWTHWWDEKRVRMCERAGEQRDEL
jgi:hypothetical protein